LNKPYIVFILSHGRADRVITYKTLRKAGYTGEIKIIIDDEDEEGQEYIDRYGKKVYIFNKEYYIKNTQTADNFEKRKAVVYARNATYDIATELGYEYFYVLDDDYYELSYRYNHLKEFEQKLIKNIEPIFGAFLEYYKTIDAKTIAFIQCGDMIGGALNGSLKKNHFPFIKRKAMNLFLCSTKRRIKWIGTINEDVNVYVHNGSKGELFLTVPLVTVNQLQTQSNSGGLTEIYLDVGTYVKSFYTVLFNPSSVRVITIGQKYRRLHHGIVWRNTIPAIIDEQYKK
jgi:hypothetical protein